MLGALLVMLAIAAPPPSRGPSPSTSTPTEARRELPMPDISAETRFELAPLELAVAVVVDPSLSPLDDATVDRALAAAARSFAARFRVPPPRFVRAARLSTAEFLGAHVDAKDGRCAGLLAQRYRGGGVASFAPHRERAVRFLERWPIADLAPFLPEAERTAADHTTVLAAAEARFIAHLKALDTARTPADTPLLDWDEPARSFASWSCAMFAQRDYDVVITNAYLVADLMREPQPHAMFGRGKVGGVAGPNPWRAPLGRQALLASTFGIDTAIPTLSELDGKPAAPAERAEILGTYLLAHEIAHSVFGLPDVFDHPGGCLMTSRPGESYRQGLATLASDPNPCPRCRPWVAARAGLDEARQMTGDGHPGAALLKLSKLMRDVPRPIHGGVRRRMSTLMLAVSQAYAALDRPDKTERYARQAAELDPESPDATAWLTRVTSSTTAGSP